MHLKTSVESVEPLEEEHGENENHGGFRFRVVTSNGIIRCKSLVIATGGLSIPTMGATGFGYDLAKTFGLQLVDRYASLVPVVLQNDWLELSKSLSGLSLDVEVEANGQFFQDPLLFTHRGLSGPAILQISNYWLPGQPLSINFLPSGDLQEDLTTAVRLKEKLSLKNWLSRLMPKRFVEAWLGVSPAIAQVMDLPVVQLTSPQIEAIANHFHCWQAMPSGTEGYRTAEVTMGGIHTNEVSSKTFEVKKVPGLFCIGEVLDVTGWLGGYNFQWAWAWASAWCAAQYV